MSAVNKRHFFHKILKRYPFSLWEKYVMIIDKQMGSAP